MSSKIAEAQSHIDGLTVARIGMDFMTKYHDVYPTSAIVGFAAVGPLQTLIGEAIRNGHLAVVEKPVADPDDMRRYAQAVEDAWIEPCPWNPFPSESPWGRAIEEGYRKRVIARRKE